MAITKIFPRHQRLDHLLSYIADEEKTGNGTLVTGVNCAPESAYGSMCASFALNDKPLRVQGYHIIQSFAQDEVAAGTAHEIGLRFAEELFGDSFQAVVATHTNTDVTHNHIALCSTSFIDGHRYHSCKDSYRRIREVSDALCREYNLSVIDNPAPGRYKTTAEVKAGRNGNQTWLSVIKADVDEAIAKATNSKQFYSNLQRLGYEVKDGKNLSVKPSGKERFVRLARSLGDDYTHEAIRQRILNQPYPAVPIPKQSLVVDSPKKLPAYPKGSVMALHRHYLYLFGYYKNQGNSSNARMHYLLREDIRKLDAIIADEKMMHSNGIETTGQLQAHYHRTERAVEELMSERKPLYRIARNADDPMAGSKASKRITAINADLKGLRRTLRQCDRIAERSEVMLEKIERIERDSDAASLGRQKQYVLERGR